MNRNGARAENHAYTWLKHRKLDILARNFHSRFGEIDIIAMENRTICFIEVRYRKSSQFGSAAETVNMTKQKKIIKTAQIYLAQYPVYRDHNARFDILSMSGSLDQPDIDWYKDAFIL